VVLPSYFLPPPEKPLEKEKTVLWLANLSPGKQPELFLKLAEACRGERAWTFVLAGGTGDRDYFERLRHQAETLPNVRLVGRVPFEETDRYFGEAALFANTSRHEAEGLPNTFIQAWFHRTPVLSLNHDPNGWIGTRKLGFCAHGDLDLWVKTGRALLHHEDKLREMGAAAARFARETFAADRTIDVYLELFAGRGSSPDRGPSAGLGA
jgi:glycosyltransferase involved in cell wall biosynthesis